MSIDPLAEDYKYNTPYSFAENRVVDGREIEGLEWSSSTSSDGKTVTLNLNVKTVNNSTGILTNEQVSILANERALALSCNLGGTDSLGRTVNVTVNQTKNATIIWEYNASLNAKGVKDLQGKPQKVIDSTLAQAIGITNEIGNTQNNKSQINVGRNETMLFDKTGKTVFDNKATRSKITQVGVHEDLHKLGLRHENDFKNKQQIRSQQIKDNSNAVKDGGNGMNVLPVQRTEAVQNVQTQQVQVPQ